MGTGGIGGAGVGLPEVFLLISAFLWLGMMAAVLFVVVTLHRLRRSVERIEQLLRARESR